jgi:hypothetical protein
MIPSPPPSPHPPSPTISAYLHLIHSTTSQKNRRKGAYAVEVQLKILEASWTILEVKCKIIKYWTYWNK